MNALELSPVCPLDSGSVERLRGIISVAGRVTPPLVEVFGLSRACLERAALGCPIQASTREQIRKVLPVVERRLGGSR